MSDLPDVVGRADSSPVGWRVRAGRAACTFGGRPGRGALPDFLAHAKTHERLPVAVDHSLLAYLGGLSLVTLALGLAQPWMATHLPGAHFLGSANPRLLLTLLASCQIVTTVIAAVGLVVCVAGFLWPVGWATRGVIGGVFVTDLVVIGTDMMYVAAMLVIAVLIVILVAGAIWLAVAIAASVSN